MKIPGNITFNSILRFRPRVLAKLPIPVNFRERQALELDGFPEYIAQLAPGQLQAIDVLAGEIVRSNDTNDPIFEFRVEGHADVARRITDKAERKWFEDNISQERADNAFDLLVEELKRRGGEALAKKIAKGSKAFGLGTQNLKVPNATTETQFRLNRRVVFIVREVTFIPRPDPLPPPPSVVEDRFRVRLINAGVITVGITVGTESVTVTGTISITDIIDKKSAQFNFTATGGGLGLGLTKLGGSVSLSSGDEVGFKIFRLASTAISLSSIEGLVTVFVDPSGSAGPVSAGGKLTFSFDALEDNGANTMPQLIAVPAGKSSFSGASIDSPAVTIGRLTMMGTPANL